MTAIEVLETPSPDADVFIVLKRDILSSSGSGWLIVLIDQVG